MKVLMPQLGETVTEGTVSKWHKKIGDNVKTVPQVYIDEKRIGGYPQLKDWLSE